MNQEHGYKKKKEHSYIERLALEQRQKSFFFWNWRKKRKITYDSEKLLSQQFFFLTKRMELWTLKTMSSGIVLIKF